MMRGVGVFWVVAMLVAASACWPDTAPAQGLVQKLGDRCPRQYAPDGGYCKPLRGAREIIAKIGRRCPSGFAPDGDYCYRAHLQPARVVPKVGSRCPRGFSPDGEYCKSLD